MPRSGGIYSLPPGYEAVTGETIQPSQHNPPLEDIAQALTGSLPRDGSAGMSNDLPMGNNQITGLGAGSAPSHAVRMDQTWTGAFVTSLAALGSIPANRLIYSSATDVAALAPLSAYGRGLVAEANAGLARAYLNAPPADRTITAGDGLSGGGDLTANRALAVDGTVVRTTRQVIAGNGLIGGGPLSSNVTVTMGAPSSITAATGNSATATTHTHELEFGTVRTQLASEAQTGTVGTYAMLRLSTGGVANPNQNIPASAIDGFANASSNTATGAPAGTWKCMGYAGGAGNNDRTTLFLRVS